MGSEEIEMTPVVDTYWKVVWQQFKKNRIAFCALWVFGIFLLVGLYAPFFASSKPLIVVYEGKLFFPLFRYLLYSGFYTKPIDLFYNILMFVFPLMIIGLFVVKQGGRKTFLGGMALLQFSLFTLFSLGIVKDPASHPKLLQARQEALQPASGDPLLASFAPFADWQFDLGFMNDYAKINLLLRHHYRKKQHSRLTHYAEQYLTDIGREMPTLWGVDRRNESQQIASLSGEIKAMQEEYEKAQSQLPELMAAYRPFSHRFLIAQDDLEKAERRLSHLQTHTLDYERAKHDLANAQNQFDTIHEEAAPIRTPLIQARGVIQRYRDTLAKLTYYEERQKWLVNESQKLSFMIPALFRSFHWEDDAGGQQSINKYIPWWELTRINRKDLVSGLIFGMRISLVVGVTAVVLSLLIGIPLGTISAYFAGKTDIVICRLIEIWEAMPTFFMLLLVVAITQSKSIFLVIAVLGIFGWTGFGRFIRGEVLRQRNLPYVLACHSVGYGHGKIMFSHILPNAIPPILTLLPFSMMAAITSEAGLSFLGLGEEGSTSWGVLMDEGRSVFPGESYLLWPPAILLTLLLISIALVGDGLRDALDPRLRR